MKRAILPVAILGLGFLIASAIIGNPPEGRRFGQRPAPAVAVETQNLEKTSYQVTVESYGVTQPRIQTNLVPEVGGRVMEVSDAMLTGAFFEAGEVLLKLDQRDFKVELAVAEAALADAKVALEQEKAEAAIAEQDWNRRPGNPAGRDLALRKPQIAAAEAQVKAAEARLMGAQLNLDRTTLKAPYSGRVLAKMVDVGQVINSNTVVAEVYATDAIEVRLPIQTRDQEYLNLPGDFTDGEVLGRSKPLVTFYADMGMNTYQWRGEIVRTEASIDAGTRQLFVIAQIDNPYDKPSDKAPALKIGQFVRANIQGDLLEDVYVLPRRAVSQDNLLGVVLQGRLDKRPLQPIWSDAKNIIVKDGVTEGESFSLTPINNVPAGTKIRSINQPPAESGARSTALDGRSGPANGS